MKKIGLLLAASLLLPLSGWSKDLTSRLGLGYRNASVVDLPSVAVNYHPNPEYSFLGSLGIDTQDSNARFGLMAGVRKTIFQEDNMNFMMGGQLGLLSVETAGSTKSGFETGVIFGAEFFMQGLENLGFNFESGVLVANVDKVRFKTTADSFIKAGLFFYF